MAETDHPDQQLSDLSEWRQGDFALCVGPFIYGDRPDNHGGAQVAAFLDDQDPEGLVVISQTCDIVSDPEKNPWVVVCPLVTADQRRVKEIERGTAPRFSIIENAPPGVVVEIYRPLTISKSLLSSWSRSQGFNDRGKALEFARSLERCFGRFAFPDDFNASISPLLKRLKDAYGKPESTFGRAARSITEIRVRPTAAWEAEEVRVRFFLILKPQHDCEAKPEDISSAFEGVLKALPWKNAFRIDDPSLQLGTYDDFLARDLIESVPLDINALSFAARFQTSE